LRLPATHVAVPLLIAAAWTATVLLAASIAPSELRSPATLVAGATVLVAAFVRWPKPTLAAFAIVVLFYDTFSVWLGAGIEQVDELTVPALLVIAAWRLKPWRRGLFSPVRDGALIVVFALGILSSLVHAVPAGIWLVSLLLMVKIVAFLHVVLWHEYKEADVRQFVGAAAAVAIVVLALGAVELVDGPAFRSAFNLPTISNPRGQLPGIKSVFYHPVLFSWFCSFVALFMFAFHTVYRRWPLLVGALVFSAGSFLSGRRRGIAGLLAALLGGAIADRQGKLSLPTRVRRWMPAATVVLGLSVLFLPSLIQLIELTLDAPRPAATAAPGASPIARPPTPTAGMQPTPQPSPTSDATPRPGAPTNPGQVRTQDARLALYLTSIDVARDRFPLGAGLGRYGSPLSRAPYSPVYSEYGLNYVYGLGWEHSDYITDTFWPQILGEAGVFALGAYVVFVAALAVSLWRATLQLTTPYLYAFALATWMVFLHALIETLASSMFHSPPRIYLLFGCVGVVIALARSARAQTDESGGAVTQVRES
jgi:hypothetical protein